MNWKRDNYTIASEGKVQQLSFSFEGVYSGITCQFELFNTVYQFNGLQQPKQKDISPNWMQIFCF